MPPSIQIITRVKEAAPVTQGYAELNPRSYHSVKLRILPPLGLLHLVNKSSHCGLEFTDPML